MKKKQIGRELILSAVLLTAFVLWTELVRMVDLQPIGPLESSVGFAKTNGFVHSLTGTNMLLYTITDWLGLVAVAFVAGFGILGLVQWIKRKSILKVDYSILILGLFYITIFAVYLLFEGVVINYRPVLINGHLEASYPSSTTLLVFCVMPTAVIQLKSRMNKSILRTCLMTVMYAFTVFMIGGRLISGVHWITDIIGSILISAGLVVLYRAIIRIK